jgi:hypothetical protein
MGALNDGGREWIRLLLQFDRARLFQECPGLLDAFQRPFIPAHPALGTLEVVAKPPGDGFDFLVLPTLRGASRAIEIVLNLHPELHSAPRTRADQGVLHGDWGGLERQARAIRTRIPNVKTGIILHSGAGLLAPFLNLVNAIAPHRPWVQVVREPVSAVLSSINHIINGEAHGYHFAKAGLPWLLDEEITRAPDLELEVAELDRPVAGDPEAAFQASLALKQDFKIGLPYSEYFGAWQVLDVADLMPATVDQGLGRLFALLGVDPSFRHPVCKRLLHGKLPRYMYMNPTRIRAYGFPLVVSLGTPGDSLLCRDLKYPDLTPCDSYLELVRFDQDARLAAVGVPGGTCVLMVEAADWCGLPAKVRQLLLEGRILETYGRKTLVPRWASHVASLEKWVAPAQVASLSRRQRDRLDQAIGDDAQAFVARHPHLAGRWRLP